MLETFKWQLILSRKHLSLWLFSLSACLFLFYVLWVSSLSSPAPREVVWCLGLPVPMVTCDMLAIQSANSGELGPGTWWDASSAFSLDFQIPVSQSTGYCGRAFSGFFHAGAIAPVYLPWGKLGPDSLPQQLSYSCIHWLVDPENTGSMLLVQFITLCSCSVSEPQRYLL